MAINKFANIGVTSSPSSGSTSPNKFASIGVTKEPVEAAAPVVQTKKNLFSTIGDKGLSNVIAGPETKRSDYTPYVIPEEIKKKLSPAVIADIEEKNKKAAQANSFAGKYKAFSEGLGKAGTEIVQGIARSAGTAFTTAANVGTKILNRFSSIKLPAPFAEETPTEGGRIPSAVFGAKPIRTLPSVVKNVQDISDKTIESITGKKPAIPLPGVAAFPIALGGIIMDLSGFGGAKAVENTAVKEIPELFFKTVAKETNPRVIEATLRNVGLAEKDVIPLAEQLRNTKTVNEAKDVVAAYKTPERLPLSKEGKPAPTGTPQEILAQAEAGAAHLGTTKPNRFSSIKLEPTPTSETSVVAQAPIENRPISSNLEEEARKYKSAEEFVNSRKGKEKIDSSFKRANIDTVYHSTSPQSARNTVFSDTVNDGLNVSTTPELALGQGGKGVTIEFDTRRLNGGKIQKPGADFIEATQGKYPEYELRNVPSKLTPDVKSVTFDVPLSAKGETQFFGNQQNWKDTKQILPDGRVKYTNPNYKTTQDLTDIYNKATNSPVSIQAPAESIQTSKADSVLQALDKAKAGRADEFKPLAERKPRPITTKKVETAPVDIPAPKIRVPLTELPKHLIEKKIDIEQRKESIRTDPMRELLKYVDKNGQLPEVLGNGRSTFKREGDKIIQKIFGAGDTYTNAPDSEVVRARMEQYLAKRKALREDQEAYKLALEEFRKSQQVVRDQIALAKIAERNGTKASKFVARNMDELEPPKVRGDIAAPRLDLFAWKDRPAIKLNRETFERNIVDVAPKKDAEAIKKFIIEPVKKNETDRIKFVNKLRQEIREKIHDWGIKKGSEEDALIQKYGEGEEAEGGISLETLKQEAPTKWKEIKEASEYFRKIYDDLLDKVNKVREDFGYNPIPKRNNYFRHFEDINNAITNFGLLFNENKLPTELAGITETFKPGKPFSTAELRRLGKKTDFSAIKGMDGYIDSISKQIYHIDSVQRYRALEKYIREAAQLPGPASEKLNLPNFVSNLTDLAGFVAGKKGRFDRASESLFGRKIFDFSTRLQRRVSANLVIGNISSALTNFISVATQVPSTTAKVPYIRGLLNSLKTPFVNNFAEVADGVTSELLTRRFPEERITNSTFENAKELAGWLFQAVDKFAAHAAVAAKYYENVGKGVPKEDAIKLADEYAGKLLSDRSVGQMPNLFQNKTLGLITQFQLEVNNIYSFIKKDIPEMYSGDKLKILNAIMQFVVYSYLFNEVYQKVTGRRPTIDLINAVLTVAGVSPEGKDVSLTNRLSLAGEDLAENLPFSGIFFGGGRIPISSALPRFRKLLTGETDVKTEAKKLATVLPPFGGGQVKKTTEGIIAYLRGNAESASGKPTYPIEHTPANAIRTSLFGPSGAKEAQGFYNEKNKESPLQATYDHVQQLVAEGREDEARSIVDGLTDEQYNEYKKVKASAKRTETLIKKTEMLDTVKQVRKLQKDGKEDEAHAIVDALSDEDYKIYQSAAKMLPADGSKPEIPENEAVPENGVIHSIVTYAKAIGTDPATAFNRIFTGQKIRRIDNGAIIVERMSLEDSRAESKKQAGKDDTSGFRLDHTIPLELGGSNSESNLKLVPTEEWASYTEVENLLGKALRAGKLKKKEAQDLILRFKKGELTAQDVESSI